MSACAPFIYGLYDPREPGHIRYVGMAFQTKRPVEHGLEALRGDIKVTPRIEWIRNLLDEGEVYDVEVLEQLQEGSSRHFVGLVERMYLQALSDIGHQLLNVHLGGWGGATMTGRHLSEETKQKISRAHLGKKRGPHSEEHKQRIALSHLGKKHSASHIEAMRGRVCSEETREKLRAASLGVTPTPETREKLKAAASARVHTEAELQKMRGQSRTEETKRNISESLKGRVPSEQMREKLRQANLGKTASEETRAKMREAQTRYWARKREANNVR